MKNGMNVNGQIYFENHYQGETFDNEMTPSKFIALFLAVNRSSLHPETSSCIQKRYAEIIITQIVNESYNKSALTRIQFQMEDSSLWTHLHLLPTLRYPIHRHLNRVQEISNLRNFEQLLNNRSHIHFLLEYLPFHSLPVLEKSQNPAVMKNGVKQTSIPVYKNENEIP